MAPNQLFRSPRECRRFPFDTGDFTTARSLRGVFLGEDILAWLVLALGGALAVGNLLALVRPPAGRDSGDLSRAPVARTVVMAAVGAIAAVWALASLVG